MQQFVDILKKRQKELLAQFEAEFRAEQEARLAKLNNEKAALKKTQTEKTSRKKQELSAKSKYETQKQTQHILLTQKKQMIERVLMEALHDYLKDEHKHRAWLTHLITPLLGEKGAIHATKASLPLLKTLTPKNITVTADVDIDSQYGFIFENETIMVEGTLEAFATSWYAEIEPELAGILFSKDTNV
jgi:hypothetical protein